MASRSRAACATRSSSGSRAVSTSGRPIAGELRDRATWKIADDHGPFGRAHDRGSPRSDTAGLDHGRGEDTRLGALAVDFLDRSHRRLERLDLALATGALERRAEE